MNRAQALTKFRIIYFNMDITLLKLGGSLITDKNTAYSAKPALIKQAFEEIKEEINKNQDLHLIIGHGAGSYAHQSAKKYNTMYGFENAVGKFGACAVHADALELNQIVIEEAIKLELPIFSLQPAAFIMSQNRHVHLAEFSILKEVLKKGLTPLIFGDVIIDTQIGATIFSTDTLFSILVNKFNSPEFKITKIIHAGNYDGVLDEKKEVISQINTLNFPQIKQLIGSSENVDVTGGMLKKVEESMVIAQKGIMSHIINGSKKGNLSRALNGDYSFGTCISDK